jgi:uncharacterized protein (TIGR00369 family)
MSDPEHPFWKAVRGDVPPAPAAKLLGWKVLEATPDSGRIRVQYDAPSSLANPLGTVQGGFVAAMLDDTLGPSLATTLEKNEFGVTIELKTNFVRPAKPGILVGEGRVVHRGSSIAFVEGTLVDADGQLVATTTATMRIVRVGEGGFRV